MDNPEKLETTQQKYSTICVEHHYPQTNTNNVSKTCDLLQTNTNNVSKTCDLLQTNTNNVSKTCDLLQTNTNNVSKTCDLLDRFGNCRITYISVCTFSVCLTDKLIYKEMKLELNNHIWRFRM
jgi:hypothetical protein